MLCTWQAIEFRCAKSIDSDLFYEHIRQLLHALHQNGQICGREYPITIAPDGVMAMVVIPAEDALHESHHNSYVRQDIDCFREIEVDGPHFSLIGEDMAVGCRDSLLPTAVSS